LKKRHKKTAYLAIFILFASMFISTIAYSYANNEAIMPEKFVLHRVKKGDTLWGLSRRYMPGVDPRDGVRWIREANSLARSELIYPGDILNIPCEDGNLTEPLGPNYESLEAMLTAETEAEKLMSEAEEEEDEPVPVPASRGGQTVWLIMEATAYTAGPESTGKGPGDEAYGITKSGLPVDAGVVAVDPEVVPLGSVVWVEDYGYAVALDVGGAIKGNKIDVFFWDLDQAKTWGRKQVRVRVISAP
jgi:3D (Asp-Asp-Asp) domain-containing protein